MAQEREQLFAFRHIPNFGRVVAAGSHQATAVLTPGDCGDCVVMAVQISVQLSCLNVPDADRKIRAIRPIAVQLLASAAAGQIAAVGREGDCPDDVLVLLPDPDRAELFLLEYLEELGGPVTCFEVTGQLRDIINPVPSGLSEQ